MVQAAEEHCLVRGRREAHDVTLRAPPVSAKKGVASLPTKGENINICWSPDGNTIAVGSKEDTVSFIDKRTRTIIDKPWPFKMEVLLPSRSRVHAVALQLLWNEETNACPCFLLFRILKDERDLVEQRQQPLFYGHW